MKKAKNYEMYVWLKKIKRLKQKQQQQLRDVADHLMHLHRGGVCNALLLNYRIYIRMALRIYVLW